MKSHIDTAPQRPVRPVPCQECWRPKANRRGQPEGATSSEVSEVGDFADEFLVAPKLLL